MKHAQTRLYAIDILENRTLRSCWWLTVAVDQGRFADQSEWHKKPPRGEIAEIYWLTKINLVTAL